MKSLGLFTFFVLGCVISLAPAHAGFRYMPANGSPAANADVVVEGFADQVPLTVALRQILPRGTVFNVADNVDMSTKVSWQGGRPWHEVLDASLQSAGLSASYKDNTVRVEKSGFAGTSSASSNAPIKLQPPIVLTPPSSPRAAYSNGAPLIVQGEVTSLDPDAGIGAQRMVTDNSIPSSTVQQLGTTKPSAPLPDARVSKDVIVADDFNGQPKSTSLAEITSMDPDIKAEVQAGQTGPLASSSGFLTVPDKMAGSSLAPLDAGSSGPATPYGTTGEWHAKAGQMLHDVLMEWGQRAGVEINWQCEFDYPIQASISANGTFEDATRTLLYGFRDADPQPVGRLHKNDELGQQVLVISVRGAPNEE